MNQRSASLLLTIALFSLSGCGNVEQDVDALVGKLTTGDENAKIEAAIALGKLGPRARKALPELRRVLEGANVFSGIIEGSLVDEAASAMAAIGGKEMVPVWLSTFDNGTVGEAMLAGMILERVGTDAIPPMCDFITKSKNQRARAALAIQLGMMTEIGKAGKHKPLALSTLRKCATSDADASVRLAATQALKGIESDEE